MDVPTGGFCSGLEILSRDNGGPRCKDGPQAGKSIRDAARGRTWWAALEKAGRTLLMGELEAASHPSLRAGYLGKEALRKLSTRGPYIDCDGQEIRRGAVGGWSGLLPVATPECHRLCPPCS